MSSRSDVQAVAPSRNHAETDDRRSPWLRVGLFVGTGALVLALFTRVMSESLRHDEQLYFSIGAVFGDFALYQEISYGHLPNLPILLHSFLAATGAEYRFLAARFLVFLCWIALLYVFASVAWRLSGRWIAAVVAIILLVTNNLFVDFLGMMVAPHLFPICLAAYALLFMIIGAGSDHVRPIFIFLCGLCLSIAVGFRVNYIFIIPPFAVLTLFVPEALSFDRRLIRMTLPMALGGMIGALPTLYYLVMQTDVFLFNVLEYFIGPQYTYWSTPENAAEAEGLSLAERLIYGYRLWTTGATLLIAVPLCYYLTVALTSTNAKMAIRRWATWPMLLCVSLTALGIVVSFVPSPSFPQYFTPPVPFAILLLMCVIGVQTNEEFTRSRPLLVAVCVVSLVSGAPLFRDIPKLLMPSAWEGTRVHRVGERIREELAFVADTPRIATLSPVYAIEAGADVYPELASGPFYYRVGKYLLPEVRQAYRITSSDTIMELLEHQPPDAVLVGHERMLDTPLENFARIHGYVAVGEPLGGDRYGDTILYVRPTDAVGRLRVP